MGVLVLSLVFSIFAVCVAMTKNYVLTWRSCQGETNQQAETALSWIILLLNLLLLVFSILGRKSALQVLLSLANGALIFYQFVWAWIFAIHYGKWFRRSYVIAQIFLFTAMCILSLALPSIIQEGYEAWHVVELVFFAVEYVLLVFFYGHMFLVHYRKPKHQMQLPDRNVVRDHLVWNTFLSIVAIIGVIPSLCIYLKDRIDFESSLWIKYGFAAVWFVRWFLLQSTSESNSKALWFLQWLRRLRLQSTVTNANPNLPSFSIANNTDPGFQSFAATDANSNTPSFATKPFASNEALCGLDVTLPSPVLRIMPSQQSFEPNTHNIQRNSSQGARYMWSASLSSATTHEGWEQLRGTSSKRPPCPVTAKSYILRWERSLRQQDPRNMKIEKARKRIHPSDTDTANTRKDLVQGVALKLIGSDIDCARDYPQCTCADFGDSSGSALCHLCGHLCCFTSIQGLYSVK